MGGLNVKTGTFLPFGILGFATWPARLFPYLLLMLWKIIWFFNPAGIHFCTLGGRNLIWYMFFFFFGFPVQKLIIPERLFLMWFSPTDLNQTYTVNSYPCAARSSKTLKSCCKYPISCKPFSAFILGSHLQCFSVCTGSVRQDGCQHAVLREDPITFSTSVLSSEAGEQLPVAALFKVQCPKFNVRSSMSLAFQTRHVMKTLKI